MVYVFANKNRKDQARSERGTCPNLQTWCISLGWARWRTLMRLLTAFALIIFCTTLLLFRSELSTILLSIINNQNFLRLNDTTAQTITAAEASEHVGERTTVCGRIASEHTATSSRGTPTFINLDKPNPD